MASLPVAILGSGMVTGVGLNAPATCAAIRCAIDNFSETRFIDAGGQWIVGCQAPLEQPWRGLERLVHMVVPAIKECLAQCPTIRPGAIPLLLCVAEPARAGRIAGIDERLLRLVEAEMRVKFHPRSTVIPKGRVAAAHAMLLARALLHERERCPVCVIAGVDGLLNATTLAAYEAKARLFTSKNSNGFIPGEAGTAVLVGPPSPGGETQLLCLGVGAGQEKATIEAEGPLRADGMAAAFKAALSDGGVSFDDIHYRITDSNGEQYWFKEAALALSRTVRKVKPFFDIWHPADCVGEIGAAIGPCVLGLALAAARKAYAPGPGVLCHFASDDADRQAMVLCYRTGR